jgi:hypothetical protein
MSDIELSENPPFERAEFRAQRLARMLLVFLVIGSVFGLFGPGVRGLSEAVSPPLAVRFSRFERMSSPTELTISISPEGVRNGRVQLWFARDYFDNFEIASVIPAPQAAFSAGERVVYEFQAAPGMPVKISFHMRITEGAVGRLAGELGLDTGGEAKFWQFVWP